MSLSTTPTLRVVPVDVPGAPTAKPLVVVVGYDGSEPSGRALDRSIDLLEGRKGSLEVVYVSHLPAGTVLAPEAITGVRQGFVDQAGVLEERARAQLARDDHPWNFRHLDGPVPFELMAVAAEIRRRDADRTDILIVVGGSAHWYHHLAGSVSSSVVRRDRFPVLVVP